MLVDWQAASIICAVIQERVPNFQGGEAAADRDEGPRPDSWWDRVAERWPNGGRFPSFIFIDQSA
jgi:hypothetical protein